MKINLPGWFCSCFSLWDKRKANKDIMFILAFAPGRGMATLLIKERLSVMYGGKVAATYFFTRLAELQDSGFVTFVRNYEDSSAGRYIARLTEEGYSVVCSYNRDRKNGITWL